MALSVNISVEAPVENQIQEIAYDGTEIYQTPLSMSENLAKLAQKIDFNKVPVEDKKEPNKKEDQRGVKRENGLDSVKSSEDTDTNETLAYQSSTWPWESVRAKLRNALTEVCVLYDVLAIAKEKKYMVLDPVPQDQSEAKAMAQIYARKKALTGAASVLISGAERMRASQSELSRNRSPDFHIELLRLRQNWRLKKVSNSIIGDLSYRTAGSKYAQTGMFEVTKAEDDEKAGSPPSSPNPSLSLTSSSSLGSTSSVTTAVTATTSSSASASSSTAKVSNFSGISSSSASALRVTVPSELQGVAYIEVLCQKDYEDLCSANINLLSSGPTTSNTEQHWQQKLEAAQNVLFCKELFNQLAKEAVQLQGLIPHMVVGNQIMATVLPGIQLIIGLCHSTGNEKKSSGPPPQKTEHDHVLEHSLHQLLREVHHNNTHHPFPHPSSGPIGPSKKRILAGPMASDRYELVQMTKSQTLLEQIIEQAQHFFMRLRTEYVLDTIAKEMKDPLIVSHWNALNSPTQSCVKINIMTHGYDTVCRTSLVVHIGEKTLKCVCRDGRVMHMSYEPQELRDLLYCQIYQHQITAVQALAKCMGWQILANSLHLGLGSVEPLGNASSIILTSPTGDRMIAVRCEPQSGIQVWIAQSPRKDFFPGQLVKERKWENLGGGFKEVRWDKMEGKNFLNKMELLMASLTSSQ